MGKRLAGAALAAAVLALAAGGTAQAAPISPDPVHVARTYTGTPWRTVRTYTGTPWRPVRTYAPERRSAALWVTVRPGDTPWGLASAYRGSGYEWPRIARLNGLDGTTIYAGTTLRVR